EITEIETQLVKEGLPVEEIQNLCDVHASVFKGTVEEIHQIRRDEDTPGHPIHTFRVENKNLEEMLEKRVKPHIESFEREDNAQIVHELKEDFKYLWELDKHYGRKENLVFPYMEKYDITAPPQVMWAVDDENRNHIKEVRNLLKHYEYDHPKEDILEKAKAAVSGIEEMIFKEENILFPMVLDTFNDREWKEILDAGGEYGYFFFEPVNEWKPKLKAEGDAEGAQEGEQADTVHFDAGFMTPEEVNAMLNTLPIDMTFVDKNGKVKYFSQGKERIFARPKTIIGREVKNCHPPSSVHIVEQIVEELKSGKKDHEDFWIQLGDKFAHIRYFAVRNDQGEFLGVVEVSQDIKPIQEITGEKRLVEEEE
ncbi:MAG TPA: PAS domain S-box protein, partial [Eubacteriaceae bacterium]|nr:PAS domain S-box protein [Eubacteriaceae bacterium]